MQLFVIDWSFQNTEDQLFAINEFCQFLREGKLNENIEGFELKYIAHTPQNGSGVIICEAHNTSILLKCGSPEIRTQDQPVKSRMLYR